MQAISAANGKAPPELERHSVLPPHFGYLWRWFAEMTTPLSWQEIESWSHFSGIRPTRKECEILLRLDGIRNA